MNKRISVGAKEFKSPSRYFFMAQEDAEFLYFTTNMKRKEKPA